MISHKVTGQGGIVLPSAYKNLSQNQKEEKRRKRKKKKKLTIKLQNKNVQTFLANPLYYHNYIHFSKLPCSILVLCTKGGHACWNVCMVESWLLSLLLMRPGAIWVMSMVAVVYFMNFGENRVPEVSWNTGGSRGLVEWCSSRDQMASQDCHPLRFLGHQSECQLLHQQSVVSEKTSPGCLARQKIWRSCIMTVSPPQGEKGRPVAESSRLQIYSRVWLADQFTRPITNGLLHQQYF